MDKVFKFFATGYDVITFPIYYPFARNPKSKRASKIRGRQEDPSDPYSPWIRVGSTEESIVDGCNTVDDLTRKFVQKYGDKRCMGIRKTTGKDVIASSDGRKMIKKMFDPEYTWYTYHQVDQRIESIMRGLISHGIKQKDYVVIFMETRMEWMLAAQALYRMGSVVATLYATLGDDGVTFGVNEVEATHLITSNDLLPKIKKLRPNLSTLKTVIYVCDKINGEYEKQSLQSIDGVELVEFHQLESEGSKLAPSDPFDIKPEDNAILMYTSGSTGNPKGVLLNQTNTLNAIKNIGLIVHEYQLPDDATCIGYLPLAHIMELVAEPIMLSQGVAIGYSSPLTLMMGSPGLKKGCLSDMEVLKPDVFMGVPLMLDRLRKTVEEKVRSKGWFMNEYFKFAVDYKQDWSKNGFQTPLLDQTLFNKKKLFGGRLKFIITGGAPLSPDTAIFTKNVLGVHVMQAYASTESGGAGCSSGPDDTDAFGRVGGPTPGSKIKLIEWEEGNYRPTDKPNPRGEIVIGSKSVSTSGYFKNPDLTREVFTEDSDGLRWVCMGDIGEFYPDGTIKIIDRKKDLVKLQMGEYVSLGKVSIFCS